MNSVLMHALRILAGGNLQAVAPQPNGDAQAQQQQEAAANPGTAQSTGKKRKKKVKPTRPKKEPKVYPAAVQVPKKLPGSLYVFGTNTWGQVGTQNPSEMLPALVPNLENILFKTVACGGKHTLVLDKAGQVWSFGSNEERALGRLTNSEEEERTPGIVSLPKKCKQISAGESHSVALTVDGEVYAWGCYKTLNEKMLSIDSYQPDEPDAEFCEEPWLLTYHLGELYDDVKIIKIASGANHIVMLGDDSRLYTCGTWEFGQLGRDQFKGPKRQTRSDPGLILPDKEFNLRPDQCMIGHKYNVKNIWASKTGTFCYGGEASQIYVCGNNLYSQLGMEVVRWDIRTKSVFHPSKATSFNRGEPGGHRWRQIEGGEYHTVALTEDGKVYSIGQPSKGKVGCGGSEESLKNADNVGFVLKPVNGLENQICVQIAAGRNVSYALTIEGILYSWGSGEKFQLGLGNSEDSYVATPSTLIQQQLGNAKRITRISVGDEHIALIIANTPQED